MSIYNGERGGGCVVVISIAGEQFFSQLGAFVFFCGRMGVQLEHDNRLKFNI